MRPKLIATDLDGTLIGRDLQVSDRTKRAIARAHELEIPVVMATGRMYCATVPFARACSITTPLITYQGAMIRELDAKTPLWHRTIPSGLAREAMAVLRETGLHVNLYLDDELIIERVTPESELYCSYSRIVPKLTPSLEAALKEEPTKMVAIGEPKQIQHWLPILQEHFKGRLYVTESLPMFLEIAHPEISKSAALKHVAERYGVFAHEILAFGDGMNDLDMLRYAGLGVAMGNAPELVKASADRIAPPQAQDGVAQIMEELLGK